MNTTAKDRITIILHSGGYDRVSYALSLAIVALTTGSEVHMFLTYGGLKRFSRGHLEYIGEETSGDVRDVVEHGLGSGGIKPLEQALDDAKRLGLRIYACPNSMANLNITRAELIPQVDLVMGLVTFMELARSASINWYI